MDCSVGADVNYYDRRGIFFDGECELSVEGTFWKGRSSESFSPRLTPPCIDDETYHRRSIVEAIFYALRKRSGATLKARTWFGQFRELVLKAAVRNIEHALKT